MAYVVRLAFVSALLLGLTWAADRYEVHVVKGEAAYMQPAVKPSIARLFNARGLPPLGAVVWFAHRDHPRAELLARVVGTPGQRIAVVNDQLRRDGAVLGEGEFMGTGLAEFAVPAGHIFVLCDQWDRRGAAERDSRFLGPIPQLTIKGWLAP